MTDETAKKAEEMAQMIATCIRLSEMMHVTLDDAVSLMTKFCAASARVEAMKRSVS